MESPLLDGHLSLIVELLSFRTTSERYRIGGHPDGDQLIKVNGVHKCLPSCLSVVISTETSFRFHVSSIKIGQRSKREPK